MRPLDRVRSIKVKFGGVILVAVAMTLVVNEIGLLLDVEAATRVAVAALLALALVQLLARGMTSPLREMAAAAGAMARGDYSRTVTTSSSDEVGELARAFTRMATDLAAVDAERRRLVADVSHELRTPLAALQALLENLADGVTAPDLATFETALAQTTRLGRLVEQLLDLSRLESGVAPLEPRRTDVAQLVDQAVREVELSCSGVRLEQDVRPSGLTAVLDPERLHQVLANLLDNAVRHSPPDGSVRVCARRTPAGVRLTVEDDGPGIAAADRERVFERFARADAARHGGGSGLGLAITRWVVDLHGGAVHVEPVHVEPVHVEPVHVEPAHVEPVLSLPGGVEPVLSLPGCRVVVDLPDRPPPARGQVR